jgi:hypothetical protein
MSAKKRTYEKVVQLYFDIFYLGMTLNEAITLNGLSKSVGSLALQDAIRYNLITKEQYNNFLSKNRAHSFHRLSEKLSEEEVSKYYSNLGIKSASSKGIAMLTVNAAKGGYATQKKHAKKVAKNLRNAKPYGCTSCYYEGIQFGSQGERITALLLKSYGLLEQIIQGENFQKSFGNYKVDFFIPETNLIIEYHPLPKQKFTNLPEEFESSIIDYQKRRIDQLSNYFDGKIVTIPAPSGKWSANEFFTRLPMLGLHDNYNSFLEKCRHVREEIIKHDKKEQLSLDMMKKMDDAPF